MLTSLAPASRSPWFSRIGVFPYVSSPPPFCQLRTKLLCRLRRSRGLNLAFSPVSPLFLLSELHRPPSFFISLEFLALFCDVVLFCTCAQDLPSPIPASCHLFKIVDDQNPSPLFPMLILFSDVFRRPLGLLSSFFFPVVRDPCVEPILLMVPCSPNLSV